MVKASLINWPAFLVRNFTCLPYHGMEMDFRPSPDMDRQQPKFAEISLIPLAGALQRLDEKTARFRERPNVDCIFEYLHRQFRKNSVNSCYGLEMSNKKPVGSLIGAVIFGAITAFFLLAFFQYQSVPDGALTSAFALLLALPFGIGFMVFLLIWAVKTRKYEKE